MDSPYIYEIFNAFEEFAAHLGAMVAACWSQRS